MYVCMYIYIYRERDPVRVFSARRGQRVCESPPGLRVAPHGAVVLHLHRNAARQLERGNDLFSVEVTE